MMMDVMMVGSESIFHFQGLGTSWWWTSWAGSTSRTGRETPSGEFPLTIWQSNTNIKRQIQRQIQKDEYKHTHYQGGKVKMSQRWRSRPLLVRLSDWGTVLSMGWEIWIYKQEFQQQQSAKIWLSLPRWRYLAPRAERGWWPSLIQRGKLMWRRSVVCLDIHCNRHQHDCHHHYHQHSLVLIFFSYMRAWEKSCQLMLDQSLWDSSIRSTSLVSTLDLICL